MIRKFVIAKVAVVAITAAIVAVVVFGPAFVQGDDLPSRLDRAVAARPMVVLAGLTDFDWDRVHIFQGGRKVKEMNACLGTKWSPIDGYSMLLDHPGKDAQLIVFTRDTPDGIEVVNSFVYSSGRAHFAASDEALCALDRQDAVFQVERDGDQVSLVP